MSSLHIAKVRQEKVYFGIYLTHFSKNQKWVSFGLSTMSFFAYFLAFPENKKNPTIR